MSKKTLTQSTYDTNNIQSLANQVKGQATALKVSFDKTGNDAKTYNNGSLIVELQAETPNATGANAIGSEAIMDAGITNVGDELKSAKTQIDAVTTDEIGDRQYTEDNYVTDSQTVTASIDALDIQAKVNADLTDDKAEDDEVVHNTGNETVAGIKNFTSSPTVPVAATDTQTPQKKYVDDADTVLQGQVTTNNAKVGITPTQASDITANNAKVTNATHTGEVTGDGALTIADNIVDEANLKLDEAPTNGYQLVADNTKSGGMKWLAPTGGGDMLASTYDPNTVSGDAFDMDNMVEGATTKILTATERTAISNNSAKVSYPGSADATELNILDGATLTTTELNYVDGVTSAIQAQLDAKATTDDYTATVPSASWTGGSAPYTKVVAVTGILATDTPIADMVPTGTYATDVILSANWGLVYRITTALNSITVYANEVPSADMPIILKAVR